MAAGADPTSTSDAIDPAQILHDISRLIKQNDQLLDAFRQLGNSSDPKVQISESDLRKSRQDKYKRRWREEILPIKINNDKALSSRFKLAWESKGKGKTAGNLASANGINSLKLPRAESILNPDSEMYWEKSVFSAAYPRLRGLLETAHHHQSKLELPRWSQSYVKVIDRIWNDERGLVVFSRSMEPGRHMWEKIRVRSLMESQIIPSRTLWISDMDALTASLVLASTPQIDVTYVSPFLERYIKFSNWAVANFIPVAGRGVPHHLTYLFEYHFAFYNVPRVFMDEEHVQKDFRGIRRAAPFRGQQQNKSRFIFEEQMSFILVGHGADIYTNYQLAEEYYIGSYLRSGFKPFAGNGSRRPCEIFLTWILRALHHVVHRWETVIEAVDKEVDSRFEVIFEHDPSDLLSEDPNFQRSKSFFWAIQVYTCFEEQLIKTINTWDQFEAESLDKVDDDKMSPELRQESIKMIGDRIRALRQKVEHVQKKRDEATSLRDGLFGASSSFDTRISVNQGDNIRLLTYVNILFLPLSFSTSIFGMQVIPKSIDIHVFAIVLASVTVFTLMFCLNLHGIIDNTERYARKGASRLRRHMEAHPLDHWRKTANNLNEDLMASQEPVKKFERKSTGWMYFVFVLEFVFVAIPAHEIRALPIVRHKIPSPRLSVFSGRLFETWKSIDGFTERADSMLKEAGVSTCVQDDEPSQSKSKVTKFATIVCVGAFDIVRLILCPLWALFIGIELAALYIYLISAVVVLHSPASDLKRKHTPCPKHTSHSIKTITREKLSGTRNGQVTTTTTETTPPNGRSNSNHYDHKPKQPETEIESINWSWPLKILGLQPTPNESPEPPTNPHGATWRFGIEPTTMDLLHFLGKNFSENNSTMSLAPESRPVSRVNSATENQPQPPPKLSARVRTATEKYTGKE